MNFKKIVLMMSVICLGFMSCTESAVDDLVVPETVLDDGGQSVNEQNLKGGGFATLSTGKAGPRGGKGGGTGGGTGGGVDFRDGECGDCDEAYAYWVTLKLQCSAYGGSYCFAADNQYAAYLDCSNNTMTCPGGFIFDSANCYSGIHFPPGYEGFVWNNNFYVEPNTSVPASDSNGCPGGFTFDGANCWRAGLYAQEDNGYEGFVWNNAFYTSAVCK